MAGQLSDKYMSQLESWIGTGPKIFTLLYQITRDGCNATTFHQKCDNQGPTVTVLYNQEGSVYGGYGSLSWNSSSGWITDANAFIFQLRYSGSDKPTKFPIKDTHTQLGLYGNSTYGPTFGGGHDLQAFTGTVNSSGGYFALNGRMNVHSFDYQGLTVDKINNGNLQVTELEVYAITDGQRKMSQPKQTQPWRKTPEWTEKYLETLTEDIVSFKPSCELGLSDVRILMLGPVGTGKSSFYNTVNSVFKGRISHNAPCGVASNGITIAYNPYAVNMRSGATLNFRLCDTRGLEINQGLDILEFNYLLDGNIPDHYQFNPVVQFCPDHPAFVYKPRNTEKIHCVLYVIDATTLGDIPPKLVDKMSNFQRLVNQKGIPQAVMLTKVDLACQNVASTLSSVFTSKKIEDAVNKVSSMFGLPRNHVLPVKNYDHEIELDDNISILALLALRQLLHFAEDYIQVLQDKLKSSNEKPNKRESIEKGSDQE
ncbi:interferon-induced protein 44-like [Dreissena polymorpha]|uniref:interferon-induced protein 44-like n=1 Tax=Dreissena polymorpha TaxID=45954 RepID=UPI0022642660|nr:interferon-induced protein 44-like [Dreissena polymorpha]XP_052213305.1 interferon-induced protein 44-like [Dreissena polymorpha]XP_052213306.1 interferon-induced protein 44-like [Dreissena polymorpha]